MNELNQNELILCRYISDLFEYSTKEKNCSSKIFIKDYVYSSIQKRTSSTSFLFEVTDIPQAYEIIAKEKKLNQGKDVYPSYVMRWIGFIMKYMSLSAKISERYIYKNIKPEEFYKMYEAYHSLDNNLAVKRILESKQMDQKVDLANAFIKIYL